MATPPRIHVATPLSAGLQLDLPAAAARHVQVLRLQPGDPVTLFDGGGGEWAATITHMGRRDVGVSLDAHHDVSRELPRHITLAVGMPANERFDWLIEKATELGVAVIQPLMTERSVLRLSGERAQRKREHWQAVAIAAAEQSGRTRIPQVHEPQTLAAWLPGGLSSSDGTHAPQGCVLSPSASTDWSRQPPPASRPLVVLSGPEGGLSPQEQAQAVNQGFEPVSLGPRILRAETAPLVVLASLALLPG